MSLRLFLLAAQAADYCGFEDLAYEFYVQSFSVYEESISDSRAQLQAITTITGALQGAKVFTKDSYDTLSTKAALHAAKLLKKPHQSMAVQVASHLWWQQPRDGREGSSPETTVINGEKTDGEAEGAEKEEVVSSPVSPSLSTDELVVRCFPSLFF